VHGQGSPTSTDEHSLPQQAHKDEIVQTNHTPPQPVLGLQSHFWRQLRSNDHFPGFCKITANNYFPYFPYFSIN
jgi:hypothetical protein